MHRNFRCGPCRNFTPQLATWYNEASKRGDLEIVFMSSDRDQAAFDEYYGEMPWMALPYPDRETASRLAGKFGIRGIPSLIIVDGDGKVVTKEGRSEVMNDPTGEGFPYIPKSPKELLTTTGYVDRDGTTYEASHLDGKTILLYFSAHWCPPCRGFTPQLVETYNRLKEEGKEVEVIFLSSDRDEEAFNEYLGEMPWIALPFEDRQRKQQLSTAFKVSGIPTLVIMNDKFRVINNNGRSAVVTDPEGFPWALKPVNPLEAQFAAFINERPSLIIFSDGLDDDTVESIKAAVTPVAERAYAAAEATDTDPPLNFYYGGSDANLVKSIRDFAAVADASPVAVLIDIPSQSKHVAADVDVTSEDALQALVEAFLGKELAMAGIKD